MVRDMALRQVTHFSKFQQKKLASLRLVFTIQKQVL